MNKYKSERPSEKQIGGVEKNNVPMLVGGVPCDSQGNFSFYALKDGFLKDSMKQIWRIKKVSTLKKNGGELDPQK